MSKRNEVTAADVVTYITEYEKAHGYRPSRREMADALECGLATLQDRIALGIQEGMLEEPDGPRFRALRATRRGMKLTRDPLREF